MKKEKEIWIDVHNDKVMNDNGLIRPTVVEPRDESVWSKTPKEKSLLYKYKKKTPKGDMHFHTVPQKHSTYSATLIIYLKKDKKNAKTTISQECINTNISRILSKYNNVLKYVYNNKTYIEK